MITTHFIDSDWCLNMRIISFSTIEYHRGKSIDKKIVTCLQDWGIERLFTITIDNATTNDIVVGHALCSCLFGGMIMHLCWQDNIYMCIVVYIF